MISQDQARDLFTACLWHGKRADMNDFAIFKKNPAWRELFKKTNVLVEEHCNRWDWQRMVWSVAIDPAKMPHDERKIVTMIERIVRAGQVATVSFIGNNVEPGMLMFLSRWIFRSETMPPAPMDGGKVYFCMTTVYRFEAINKE